MGGGTGLRTVSDQMRRRVAVPDRPTRIISLVPSQTELLHDLGLGERVVGITKFCIHPQGWFHGKTRVGGPKKVDLEKVRALCPDLIIGNKEEQTKADVELLAREFPTWMSDIHDLDGALEMIGQVGMLCNAEAQAQELNARIASGFETLIPLARPVRTAYLIWRNPYMAVGGGTFINAVLQRCGLVNVFAHAADRYPVVSAAEGAPHGFVPAPELVLLSSEPYPFKEVHAAEVRALLPRAKVLLVDGEPFTWYGSRLLHSPGYFMRLLQGLRGRAART